MFSLSSLPVNMLSVSETADPYVVNVTDGSDHYEYFINVCQELGIPCPQDVHASVCQLKRDDPTFGRQLGNKDNMKLRYIPLSTSW